MTVPADRVIVLRGVVAAVVASALNAALVPVARSLDLAPGFEPISYTPVVFLTVLGATAATAVFAVVVRLSTDPARTFTRLATGVLVLSVLPDLLLLRVESAATVPGILVLVVMHVVATVVIVGTLTRGVEGPTTDAAEEPA